MRPVFAAPSVVVFQRPFNSQKEQSELNKRQTQPRTARKLTFNNESMQTSFGANSLARSHRGVGSLVMSVL